MIKALVDRTDFPILSRMSYLNSAGMGLVPLPVQHITHEAVTTLGTEGTIGFFANMQNILSHPRQAAAALFAAPASDVAIINSASEAISQIAAWRRPGPGENVVLIDIDHPSPTLPWLRWAREGAEIRWVRAVQDPASLSFEAIERLVDHNTAAISLSHVQWTTGYRFNLDALGELAKAHGALLVVDATHSAGVVPINAPQSGAHCIVTGSFKWLCAYSGTGACYLSPDIAEELMPAMIGSRTSHGDAPPPGGAVGDLTYPTGAARLEYGSSAHILRIALGAAIDYMTRPGLTAIERHGHDLGDRLIAGLDRLDATILTPRNRAARASIVTATFNGYEGERLSADLEGRGVIAIPRMGGVRFAPHSFNDEQDIDRALSVLGDLLNGS